MSETDPDDVTAPEPEAWPGFSAGFPPPPGHPSTVEAPGGRRPGRGRVALAALVAVLVFLSGGVGLWWGTSRQGTTATTSQTSNSGSRTGGSAAAAVTPAVVDVETYARSNALGGTSGSGQLVPEGAGTGLIVSSSGEVLTNNHVIRGASVIKVTISGHPGSFTASVVGADPTDDIALLQVQGVSGLPTVTLADSSTVTVGQQVVAIGNAYGRGGSPSVSMGTVSAVHRTITVSDERGGTERLSDLIQTDAPIHPGDSGGGLVTSSGQVIGIITAGARATAGRPAPNVGYAIPINAAVGVMSKIRAGDAGSNIIIGQAGYIGVQVQTLDATTADRLGLSLSSGALVVGVEPGSPAAKAGMSTSAVITAVDGHTIASTDALGTAIHAHGPGDQIEVTWVEGGASHTATMTLVTGPAV